jgi:hypothetical protein
MHVKTLYCFRQCHSGLTPFLRPFFRGQKVNAFFSDLNGPKGGIDKLCRVVVDLKRQPSLVIEDRDSELSHLIDRIIDRVGQTATRL